MKTKMRWGLVLLLAAGLLVAAGCSKDEDSGPTGPTLSAPSIDAVVPPDGQIGMTTSVRVSGAGMKELTATSVSGKLAISVTSEEDTVAVLAITVAPEALPGTDTVTVTNSKGSDSFAFTMKPANLAGLAWTNGPDLPTPRYGLTAVAVGGKVYVLGGADSQNNSVATVDILDPATNTWTTGPSLPSVRAFHSSVALDGKVYAIGGVSGNTLLTSFDVLDPTSNTWTNLQSTPTGRYGAGAGAAGGKVYVVGGYNGNQMVASTESFDLTANAWTTLASIPTPRRFFAAVPVGDRVFAIGGDDGQVYLGTTQFFNIGQNTWSTTTAMPTARRFVGGCLFLGNVVVVGGEVGGQNGASSTTVVEALNLQTNTWSTVTALPEGRDTHAVVAIGTKLYVIGGGKIDGQNYPLTAATLIGQMP